MMQTHDGSAWAGALKALLPRGLAWTVRPDGWLDRLLHGIGESLARAEARALRLTDEADPRTALETLPEWEAMLGLPDECLAADDTIPARQFAAHQALTADGGQTPADFKALAAKLGYEVEIEEFRPMRIGDTVETGLYSDEWHHVFRVFVKNSPQNVKVFRMGDRIGTRLRGWGATDLECVIRHRAPPHVHVIFAYEETI